MMGEHPWLVVLRRQRSRFTLLIQSILCCRGVAKQPQGTEWDSNSGDLELQWAYHWSLFLWCEALLLTLYIILWCFVDCVTLTVEETAGTIKTGDNVDNAFGGFSFVILIHMWMYLWCWTCNVLAVQLGGHSLPFAWGRFSSHMCHTPCFLFISLILPSEQIFQPPLRFVSFSSQVRFYLLERVEFHATSAWIM